MKIALGQINTTVADFSGNKAKIISCSRKAEKEKVDLLLFPELCVCGYPPRDLLERESFLHKCYEVIEELKQLKSDVALLIGAPEKNTSFKGRHLFNSAFLLHRGEQLFVQRKSLLPSYDVFDETRHFETADSLHSFQFKGKKILITVCEDIWGDLEENGRKLYARDPLAAFVSDKHDYIVNISASPFYAEKYELREKILRNFAKKMKTPLVYCNLVGGNDEIIFDGRSLVLNEEGKVLAQAKAFEEDFLVYDFSSSQPSKQNSLSETEELYLALKLGLHDYAAKSNFTSAVLGLSGGIDSAVVACFAAEVFGPQNVTAYLLPSPYTLQQSIDDAHFLADALKIKTKTIRIDEVYASYRKSLHSEHEITLVEENLQARIRGNILMAHSNKTGDLLLSTGNKSELSVGYCTLYGDMAGGLAVISDVPKMKVYELAQHFNRKQNLIPLSTIERPPSAELRPDQKDVDSLPPYEVLDKILKLYIEEKKSAEDILSLGFSGEVVKKVLTLVDKNEYKRRQAAPGLKVTSKAFGIGRRIPIVWKSF